MLVGLGFSFSRWERLVVLVRVRGWDTFFTLVVRVSGCKTLVILFIRFRGMETCLGCWGWRVEDGSHLSC
jgi:hypothetical protein